MIELKEQRMKDRIEQAIDMMTEKDEFDPRYEDEPAMVNYLDTAIGPLADITALELINHMKKDGMVIDVVMELVWRGRGYKQEKK